MATVRKKSPGSPTQTYGSPLNVGYGGNDNYEYANHQKATQKTPSYYQNGEPLKRQISNRYSGNDGKKKSTLSLRLLPWILSIALFALFLLSRHQVSNANRKLSDSESTIRNEVQSCSKRIRDLNLSSSDIKSEMAKKTKDIVKMQYDWRKEKSELTLEIMEKTNTVQSSSALKAEIGVWKTRETAWRKSIELLTKKIERESYREALEGFGPGPHKIKFYVDVPRDSEKDAHIPDGEHPHFTLELYPLADMPHSVHLFLEQVHHGLWDGCSFVVNAPHILQAGTFPGGNTVVTYAEKIAAFEEVGLDVVSYQEYNTKHPHIQWSVGFAGRPGGPDFYINKLDNTKNHGPGGQSQHRLEEEADPCFGHVLDGKDVLQRMFIMKTDSKNDWVMDHPVHIVKARIVWGDNDTTKAIKHAKAIPHLSEMQGDTGVREAAEPLSPIPNQK